MSILLTGFTGNVGSAIAAELRGEHIVALVRKTPPGAGMQIVRGELGEVPDSVAADVRTIIHAAANTSFRTPLHLLRATNVEGTRAMLECARRCPRLERFIHVSTVCVSGKSTGLVEECPLAEAPDFVNAYEQSKWEAEQLVLASDLPVEIVRLSIVAGRESDGGVVRLGGLHHALYWLWRGLIPMMPGSGDARVDFISTEFAARTIAGMLAEPVKPGSIVHAAAGGAAPSLTEALDLVFALFAKHNPAWSRGAIERPVLADAETWRLFAEATAQSGDAVFSRVVADAQSFLPILLHPRIYATRQPAPDWRALITRTVEHLIHTNWHRGP